MMHDQTVGRAQDDGILLTYATLTLMFACSIVLTSHRPKSLKPNAGSICPRCTLARPNTSSSPPSVQHFSATLTSMYPS
jgi:hypothetical protein